MTRWQRPPGPLNIWKVIDGFERSDDGTETPVKFSIQEIPNEEERKREVFDLLVTYYLAGEPLNKSIKMLENPDAIEDYKRTFEYAIGYNISVGCYKLDSNGNIDELVGANVLFIMTDESSKDVQKLRRTFKSDFIKSWKLLDVLSVNADPFKVYQVDKYIASISLCVNPKYAGQNLGYHMLNARSAIGAKYGIPATSTLFSAITSQKQAHRAGFEVLNSIDYENFVDEKGNPEYTDVGTKSAKLMMKRFS